MKKIILVIFFLMIFASTACADQYIVFSDPNEALSYMLLLQAHETSIQDPTLLIVIVSCTAMPDGSGGIIFAISDDEAAALSASQQGQLGGSQSGSLGVNGSGGQPSPPPDWINSLGNGQVVDGATLLPPPVDVPAQ